MAEVTATLVKTLREKTGAGMMDCKKALTETGADMDAAVDWLRKKGLASAAKKAGRVAAEGLVGVAFDGKRGAVVEVNSETDFVARNEDFQAFVAALTKLALERGSDGLTEADYPGTGRSVQDELTELVARIGENLQFRRAETLAVSDGVVAGYTHNALAAGLGKIGVLVALESTGDAAKLAELGKQMAMHVAASRPDYIAAEDVPEDVIARERAVLRERAEQSGRPPEIIDKITEGLLRDFLNTVVLLEQPFVMDTKQKVGKVLEGAKKELGAPVKVAGFVRFGLGEGIEREDADFAAEVAATLKH